MILLYTYIKLLFKLCAHFERPKICLNQPKFNPQKPTMFNDENLLCLRGYLKTYCV